jgi:predicted RNase H-like HicB family nuclease
MKFNVTIDRDEDGVWIVECPAIPGCVSQRENKEAALENIKEAIALCLEVRAEKGLPLTIETRQVSTFASGDSGKSSIMNRVQRLLLLIVIISSLSGVPVFAQVGDLANLDLPRKGKLKGIASFRAGRSLFVGVWYEITPPERSPATEDWLYIFDCVAGRYNEVFRYAANGGLVWSELMAFDAARLPGLVLLSTSGASPRGPATVIALVGAKFQVVYRGDESEFVDLDADGIPEILESAWPDGDGYPKTTRVHVWDGKRYQLFRKVRWAERYGRSIQSAVRRRRIQNR